MCETHKRGNTRKSGLPYGCNCFYNPNAVMGGHWNPFCGTGGIPASTNRGNWMNHMVSSAWSGRIYIIRDATPSSKPATVSNPNVVMGGHCNPFCGTGGIPVSTNCGNWMNHMVSSAWSGRIYIIRDAAPSSKPATVSNPNAVMGGHWNPFCGTGGIPASTNRGNWMNHVNPLHGLEGYPHSERSNDQPNTMTHTMD